MSRLTFFLTAAILPAIFFVSNAFADTPVVVEAAHYRMRIGGDDGRIESFVHNGRELIHRNPSPLVRVRLREEDGTPVELDTGAARVKSVRRTDIAGATTLTMRYEKLNGRPFDVSVTVRCPADGRLTYWSLAVSNRTDLILDHIDFPTVVVPDDLVATGGDARIFWPAVEGAVVEDAARRERADGCAYKPFEFSNRFGFGFGGGYYPSSCPMQFMAYYGEKAGLYLAAHDDGGNVKGINYHFDGTGGVQFEFRLFPGVGRVESYAMPYEMAFGVFEGDWHDAADIYRDWRDGSKMPLPPKLARNPAIPEWFAESPVVVIYPVRGGKDVGAMEPNAYYPYTRGLETLRRLNGALDSPVMALLMHWEGTAPWAPPYVWPPYGGTNDFMAFVDALHKDGNLLGLYASGVAWTTRSLTDRSFGLETEFVTNRVFNYANVAPDGKLAEDGVCVYKDLGQRHGYDLCPANAWVRRTVVDEISKILPSGVDYLQFFDQNLGGGSYFCYSRSHGHPPAPGVWQTAAMRRLFADVHQAVRASGRKILIGCESAAAEPFLPDLLLNDLRYVFNLRYARPVPAYAYLNHEYANNFMGNQCGAGLAADFSRSPFSLHQRIAYSFAAGDLLALTLRDAGEIGWGWGTAWTGGPQPDQKSILTLVRNLNAWRRGAGKPYLVYGRMRKPWPVLGAKNVPLVPPDGGSPLDVPAVFSTRWQSEEGMAQFLINYTPETQTCALRARAGMTVRFRSDGNGPVTERFVPEAGILFLSVSPLSAVMLEWRTTKNEGSRETKAHTLSGPGKMAFAY